MHQEAIDLRISCGCGFKTNSLQAALHHSAQYNHQLTIAGSVDVERAVPINSASQ